MQLTLLVPLDGSATGEDALPMALLLAERLGAHLRLIHVHEPTEQERMLGGSLAETARDRQRLASEQAYLAGWAARLSQAGLIVSTELLEGPVIASLRTAAADSGTMIVMSTRAQAGLPPTVRASHAVALIRDSIAPLLLVHVSAGSGAAAPSIRHVLVVLDGSWLAEHSIPCVAAITAACGSEVTLLHVLRQHCSGSQRAAVQNYLTMRASAWPGDAQRVHTCMVADDRPAAAILEYAERQQVDLIALTTHGRGGFSPLVSGRVADAVLRGTDLAVLISRPASVRSIDLAHPTWHEDTASDD